MRVIAARAEAMIVPILGTDLFQIEEAASKILIQGARYAEHLERRTAR
jgi:hypothetical protein